MFNLSGSTTPAPQPFAGELRPQPRFWMGEEGLRLLWDQKPGLLGLVITAGLVAAAVFGPMIVPFDPTEMRVSTAALKPPGDIYRLGTDQFGRDMLSQVIAGARVSVTIGFSAAFAGTFLGAIVALVSGYFGGRPDLLIQRLMDMMMSIPALLLAMTLVAALGPSPQNVIMAIAFSLVAGTNRVVRSQVLSVKEREYITAAVAVGANAPRIIFVHILPNCIAPYLVVASAAIATAILAEGSLGFLGLGVPPPTPSWGAMLSRAKDYVDVAPWVPVFPGLAISLAVFGFNLFGDSLRDILDPRLRGSR